MEKAKFEEAKNQIDIIDECETVLDYFREEEPKTRIWQDLRNEHIISLSCGKLKQSFICWVENEKTIAEQKLKEI